MSRRIRGSRIRTFGGCLVRSRANRLALGALARSCANRLALAALAVALVGILGCGGSPEPIPEARPGELFTDVSAAVGFDFHHANGRVGSLHFAEMMGSGAAMADFDGDGDLDLYLVQGGRLPGVDGALLDPVPYPEPMGDRLYRNLLDQGHGLRFEDVTTATGLVARGYGMGVAAADYDNDGDVDLYLTNYGPNQLLRNRGDGSFEDVTAASGTAELRWSVPALFFDYDRDGWLDLYVGNYVALSPGNEKECFAETGARDYCGPAAYDPEPDRLFHNRGDGSFEDVTGAAGLLDTFGPTLGAISADFDGDGWLDLYVANDGVANQLWLNQRDGTFRDEALLGGAGLNASGLAEASMGVAAADFDGDGDEDLFLTHLSRETNTLYLNDGGGLFEDASLRSGLGTPSIEGTGFGTAFFDYDNDGRLDLLAVNGAVKILDSLAGSGDPYPLHQRNQLFHNLGGGRFEEVTDRAGAVFELSEVSRGAVFGDVDDDGDSDVLVVNSDGPARLLLDRVGQDRSWIGLRLVSRQGRDALGAWVGVVSNNGTAWRRVRTDGSYASAGDPRVLVGLGDATTVDRVEVHWLGGGVEVWRDLEVRRYHVLEEGAGEPVP